MYYTFDPEMNFTGNVCGYAAGGIAKGCCEIYIEKPAPLQDGETYDDYELGYENKKFFWKKIQKESDKNIAKEQ